MTQKQDPSIGIIKLTDFSADITLNPKGYAFRKIECTGGTQVVLTFLNGETTTFLAAEYGNINNHAVFIRTIHAATDCTSIFAHI